MNPKAVLATAILLHLCWAPTQAADASILLIEPGAAAPAVVLERHPVQPGHRYLVEWMMKVEGERRWRYRAEFAGILVSFGAEAATPTKTVPRHSSCWATRDWRPAWHEVQAPPDAQWLSVAFWIRTTESLPGRFAIKEVRVRDLQEEKPLGADQGRLTVSTKDEGGQRTSARVYVRDASGQGVAGANTYSFNQGTVCFHEPSARPTGLLLPAGSYEVLAMKGFEHELVRRTVQVKVGATTAVELLVKRRFDLRGQGWYSGDHHTHLFRHGGSLYPMMNLPEVYQIAQGEGLDFLPFMGLDKGEHGSDEVAEKAFIGRATQELTRDFWGHLCPVGLRGSSGLTDHGDAWPMNTDYIKEARERRGAMAYAHPYGPLRREGVYASLAKTNAGLIARGFPIDVALGEPCTLDLLTKEDAEGDFQLKVRDYMWLLNLGFKVGVSGSTDFHLDQGREPIGGLRTYAKVRELTWPQIAEAYNEGRTFTSNGPLILFKVNGQEPGATVNIGRQTEVRCAVEAFSLWGINQVQIWRDGKVVKELAAVKGEVRASFALPVERSGWLLAVVTGPAAPEVMTRPEGKPLVDGQYAMTSPIYIAASRPTAPAPEAARYFEEWVDAVERGFRVVVAQTAASGKALPPGAVETAGERLAKARAVFRGKGSAGTGKQ